VLLVQNEDTRSGKADKSSIMAKGSNPSCRLGEREAGTARLEEAVKA